MSKEKVTNFKVGVFVIFGLLVFLSSMFLAGGGNIFKTYRPFHVSFEHVQGINQGSVVSLAGVSVGSVAKLDFSHQSKSIDVTLHIEETFIHRLTEGSIASVKTFGALGDKYIYISPGEVSNPPIEPGQFLITSKQKDLIDMITEKGADFENAIDLINEVKKLVKGFNEGNKAPNIMNHIESSSKRLDSLLSQSLELVKDVKGGDSPDSGLRQAIVHLTSILQKVDSGQGTLGSLINNPTIYNKLVKLLGTTPRGKYLKPLIRSTIETQENAP